MKPTKPVLNGLILTGGRSTRMGQDKSRLVYHGKPQREHLTELLQPYCQTVFWSVNVGQAAELIAPHPPCIIDAFPWPGPLNGILSALRTDPGAAWLVVACDLPCLTTRSLAALVGNRDPDRPATVFRDSDGQFPEPLLGIYEPAFGPVLHQAAGAGQYSPRRLLMRHDARLLTAPDSGELLNVNDPAARRALHGYP